MPTTVPRPMRRNASAASSASDPVFSLTSTTKVWRRKLKLKVKFESGLSHSGFKGSAPGAFNVGLIGSTCTALPRARRRARGTPPPARAQGLTLVHVSAQLKRILWDKGALGGCLRGVQEVPGVIKEYQGVFRVYFVSETAQVEVRSGRVQAPARGAARPTPAGAALASLGSAPRCSRPGSRANPPAAPPCAPRRRSAARTPSTPFQGLTLVHFSAQHERFLWERGRVSGSLGAV